MTRQTRVADPSGVVGLGVLTMVLGLMIGIGEYLCVEVAWRCLDYRISYLVGSLALCVLGAAIIAAEVFTKRVD